MIETLYQFLAALGYHHPLHPPLTHLPLGMIMGAFIFGVIALLRRNPGLGLSATHCTVLAFLGFFPTVILGYSDWQHYYQGAMVFEIQAKIVLAATLFVALALAVLSGRRGDPASRATVFLYAVCFALTIGLGYLGGELVFRGKAAESKALPPLAREGEEIFRQNCSACHVTDSTAAKLGPGLKGLFDGKRMLSSGKPVTENSVRQQIRAPAKMMPPFPSFTPQQMDALVAYLRTL